MALHRAFVLVMAVVAAGVVVSAAALAASRGIEVRVRASESADAPVTGTVQLYGASHALVIGIDAYTNGWPSLSGAVGDARVVARELKRQGFQVTLKTDLAAETLRSTLREFFAIKGADPNARLLLWYAGHGHSIGGEGFLVPADAPPDTSPAFLVSALPMRDFGSLVRLARSKHVLSVFDSCFSGTIFQARGGTAPRAITKKTTKPVRQFITSGDAGQQVRDDGSFREYFVRALTGEEKSDFNDDGYVTGEELGLFLNQQMTALTGAAQTPKSGKLHDVKFNQGDFVFVLPRAASGPAASSDTGTAAEVVFWQSIQSSTNPAMFEEFLRQFPSGRFAGLAKIKLEEFKGAQTASLPPAQAPAAERQPEITAPPVVYEAQKLLADLGYDPGPADGVMGRGTRAAIKRFQKSHGLPEDGGVTEALLAALKSAQEQVAVGVYPRAYKPGDTFKDCADCPEMVVIPPGSFRMGDLNGAGDDNEKPVHDVRIGYSIAVGKYEVTQAEWKAVMGDNPSEFRGERNPVEKVSWEGAKKFAERLSAKSGKKYRLLSEAEWEYAARAGSTTKYPWGNTASHEKANYGDDNCCGGLASGRDRWVNTSPVGSFGANAFGLHDTIGNVHEWVEDCWHFDYSEAPTNGDAWTTGDDCFMRVLRGGSWYNKSEIARSANRNRGSTVERYYVHGFRIARTLDGQEAARSAPPLGEPSQVAVVGIFSTRRLPETSVADDVHAAFEALRPLLDQSLEEEAHVRNALGVAEMGRYQISRLQALGDMFDKALKGLKADGERIFHVEHELTRLEARFGPGKCAPMSMGYPSSAGLPSGLQREVAELTGELEELLHIRSQYCGRVGGLIEEVRKRRGKITSNVSQ